jgi:hypothetical protein
MSRIEFDSQLKATLEKAMTRSMLPSTTDISRSMALALIESYRQGTAPTQGARVLAVGREDLLGDIVRDLGNIANGGSCLRVINGKFGMGKTFTLRIIQDFAHSEGFATSFLTLSSRGCPMDDLVTIYQHIVKGIRFAGCIDRPALERILEDWARNVVANNAKDRWAIRQLSKNFITVLTQYYEGYRSGNSRKIDLAIRWFCGITTMSEARELEAGLSISSENVLNMLGNFTRMLRFTCIKGLVVLLDEADSIPSLPTAIRKQSAYSNLLELTKAASTTPYSYFVYATTPAFFEGNPSKINNALNNITNLEQLHSSELYDLAMEIRDLHFKAYQWSRKDINKSSVRRFVTQCMSKKVDTPRIFVRSLVTALDICEEKGELSLDQLPIISD